MALALFDLDNTLLGGDSDHLWGSYLAQRGLVDAVDHERANQQFYDDYRAGCLDIQAFLRFALRPLAGRDPDELAALHREFMHDIIEPLVLPRALALVDEHRRRGDVLVIITATNRFVTAPIAARFGIGHLLASEGEQRDGRYTGEPTGIPCFREGKVARLTAWRSEHGHDLAGSHFYSDSHNDLPLLEHVEHPVAVDADPILSEVARQRGWPLLSLRDAGG